MMIDDVMYTGYVADAMYAMVNDDDQWCRCMSGATMGLRDDGMSGMSGYGACVRCNGVVSGCMYVICVNGL